MMERPISPEEAANKTERRWLARSQGEQGFMECGWCRFDGVLLKRHGGKSCEYCPIRCVFGCHCGQIPELCKWHSAAGGSMRHAVDEARDVYELAVRMRGALIAEAYEILKELGY